MAIYSYDITLPFTPDPDPNTSEAPRASVVRGSRLLRNAAVGNYPGTCSVQAKTGAVAASGTVTCASVLAADTVTLGGVVFTAVTGASTGDQFTRGVSDTADAAALAATINASATAGAVGGFTATSALGVVTITAKDPGKTGNAVTLASSNGGRLAVSAARLANGAGTYTTFSF